MRKRHKEKIKFTTDELMYLKRLSKSHTEKYAMVQRAQILLMD